MCSAEPAVSSEFSTFFFTGVLGLVYVCSFNLHIDIDLGHPKVVGSFVRTISVFAKDEDGIWCFHKWYLGRCGSS